MSTSPADTQSTTEPISSDARIRFMICGNGRSGTTFLTLALNNLPDVAADFEFVWRPDFRTITNVHKIIPSRFTQVSVMLDNAFPEVTAPIIGSKLVMSPRFYGALELCDMMITMDPDLRIIHLDRSSEDILTSYLKAQGSTPNVTDADTPTSTLLRFSKRDYTRQGARGKTVINVNSVISMLSQINKIARFLHIFKKTHQAYMYLEYRDINSRWDEICDFIGTRATPDERRRALEAVPIQKNPKISLAEIYENHADITKVIHVMIPSGFWGALGRLIRTCKLMTPIYVASYVLWRLRNAIVNSRIRTRFRLLRLLP